MKKTIITLFIGAVIGLAIYHFLLLPPEGTVEVKPPITHPTIITNPNGALNNSPIQMSGEMIDNNTKLRVNAWDDEKKTYADFPISCIPEVRRHIIQIGYLFQYHENKFYSSYSAVYLYSFGRVAIGGGVFASQKSAGLQACAQLSI
jgi:hypothetical protein